MVAQVDCDLRDSNSSGSEEFEYWSTAKTPAKWSSSYDKIRTQLINNKKRNLIILNIYFDQYK